MKHGLVMEGGAMRGLFTAGVIDVMMEQNIVFDGAVGVSAGAVFGCNYKSHQIGRVLRYNLACHGIGVGKLPLGLVHLVFHEKVPPLFRV